MGAVMKTVMAISLATLLVSAGGASAQAYYSPAGGGACPPNTHGSAQGCVCDEQVIFYTPGGGAPGYGGYGGGAPGYGGGYNVHLYAPGVRISGPPVNVPSGDVYVQGAPIYVQAPPVHVASPQIYLERPQVYVQPSQVTVEPPTVHVADCADGSSCEMAGTSHYAGGRQTPVHRGTR
jgi:hypothetical protein